MKNLIIYFSGTGNSLFVARELAANFDEAKIIPACKMDGKKYSGNYESIGFCFPVYAWGPPLLVIEAVKSMKDNFTAEFYYGIVTLKNEAGDVLNLLSSYMKDSGLVLDAGFRVQMPGNHIVHYDLEDQEEQQQKFFQWEKDKQDIINTIKQKRKNHYRSLSFLDRYIKSKLLYKIASRQFRKYSSNFIVNKNCTVCGICVKVCPGNNIKIVKGMPFWGNKCEECLACIHWCSNKAIDYKDKTQGRKRYNHPEITLKEMLNFLSVE
ncbi:MAG: EFR1 family ferrodoxin [Clostridiales bacterium]